jgi:hypothetical protein
MSTVTFHVTSTSNRASILGHGLNWSQMLDQPGIAGSGRPEAECVFLARDLDGAHWFVEIGRTHHPSVDIWEVTLVHDFDVYDELPPHGPTANSAASSAPRNPCRPTASGCWRRVRLSLARQARQS